MSVSIKHVQDFNPTSKEGPEKEPLQQSHFEHSAIRQMQPCIMQSMVAAIAD